MHIYLKNNKTHDNNDNNNERKWSYGLKETLLVICKFYIISVDVQRVSNSLFSN